MEELSRWIQSFKDKLDEKTYHLIVETLTVNQFTSRLQLKLLTSDQIDIMFPKELSLGAKTLLKYQLDLLKEESPLPVKQRRASETPHSQGQDLEGTQTRRCVLPALQEQERKIKVQLETQRQECREIEMSIESMAIQVQELPTIGNAKIICSYCHHRGHRNQGSNPCQLKKCTDYTFCGIKDKHPEYFIKLNSLKQDLKKKQRDIQELENQAKNMEDFSSNNEYHFIKNLTPRLYAVDPSYKTNKPKLMRDVRLLRNTLDGKIPPLSTNDPEQLRILLTKCKKNTVQQLPNAPNLFDQEDTCSTVEHSLSSSPVRSDFIVEEEKEVSNSKLYTCKPEAKASSSSSESDDNQRRKRKRKHNKKKKKRKHRSSKSSSDDERQTRMSYFPNCPRYQIPFNAGRLMQNVGLNNMAMGHDIHFQPLSQYSPNYPSQYSTNDPNTYHNLYSPFQSFDPRFATPPPVPDFDHRHIQSESTTFPKQCPDNATSNTSHQASNTRTQNRNSSWGDLNTLINVASGYTEELQKD